MPVKQPLKSQLDYPDNVFDYEGKADTSTDIFSYDTILFDLDGTIWTIVDSSIESVSAGDTIGPYQRVDVDIISAGNDVDIVLHDGIWEFLTMLVEHGISLGVISSSKTLSPNKEQPSQPAFQFLEKFDLAGYFDAGIVIEHDSIPKSRLVNRVAKGKTLLIDDTPEVLKDVDESSNVDILPRWAFTDYYELLQGIGNGMSRLFVIPLESIQETNLEGS